MKKCRTTSNNKVFVFNEQRSQLTLKNNDEVSSTKIHVDGCEIDDGEIRCDYLHIAKGIEMYIELKGQNLSYAMKQIQSTIKRLGSTSHKRICYIICTRSPLTSTEIQNYARQFRINCNAKLIIKSSPYTDSY